MWGKDNYFLASQIKRHEEYEDASHRQRLEYKYVLSHRKSVLTFKQRAREEEKVTEEVESRDK